MRQLLFILPLFFIFSCQPEVEEKTESALASKAVPVVEKQTKATAVTSTHNGNHYTVDTARKPEEINNRFPYDIEMTSVDGKKLNSAQVLRPNGKPTVLLFWLTTCYTCRIELEVIKKNYESWQKEADFNLYAISTDFQMNYENFVAMVEKNDWPFPAFHDTNREFRKVLEGGLNGLPQTFIINPEGEVVFHKRKYLTGDEDKLFAKIKEIAAQ